MPEINAGKKGIAIYLVLGALIMAVVLAKVILNIILNQATITHHRLGRVQAYYASLSGINYALEKLRLSEVDPVNGWIMGVDCRTTPCVTNFEDTNDFPVSILNIASGTNNKQFQIILCPKNASDCAAGFTCDTSNLSAGADGCIHSTVKYTAP